ncbi:MAG: rod shape-determining protein MreC [Sandarakinorhabdus sp.]|nr:rod shape-determining protein MreC [Sandarakinorhabdus sp.]
MSRPPAPSRLRPVPSRLRPGRRTSFARRDSNLALLGALFAGVILAFALLLLVMQRVNPEMGSRMRGATLDAISPLIAVARVPADAVRSIGGFLSDHWRVVETNRRLEAELAAAAFRADQADVLALNLKHMEQLISLRRPERRLVASGVASSASATAGLRSAIISVGASDGVRPRMPVIAAGGLAGRVTDTGLGAARIMLLTDANSRVPVKVLRNGWTGLATGTGGTLLDFVYDKVSATDRLRVGDRLVTSGDGGLFPPGIPVALIVRVDRNPPKARPLANPAGLGPVMVEAPWLPPPEFVPVTPAPSEPDLAVAPEPAAAAPASAAPAISGAPPASAAPAISGAPPAAPGQAPRP